MDIRGIINLYILLGGAITKVDALAIPSLSKDKLLLDNGTRHALHTLLDCDNESSTLKYSHTYGRTIHCRRQATDRETQW